MKVTLPKNKHLTLDEIQTMTLIFERAGADGKVHLESCSKGISFCLNEEPSQQAGPSQDVVNEVFFDKIIQYLNEKTGRNYSARTKSTRQKIKARVNDGASLDDFKRVIDNKVREWLDDPHFSKYLRPETLFGPKFEGYKEQVTGSDMAQDAFAELDSIILGDGE